MIERARGPQREDLSGGLWAQVSPGARKAACLVLVVVAFQAWVAGTLGLVADEAYYWTWSQRLDWGYFDHPPAIAWLVRLGTLLLGDTERGVRIMAIVVGGVGVLTVTGIVRDRMLAAAILVS
ncbi:MAG: glycosyltransferase family 39 protein, partial [Myxococcota bacterium]|nr:glycosyltransferase family 39 protein [Myxococcota bacterium]